MVTLSELLTGIQNSLDLPKEDANKALWVALNPISQAEQEGQDWGYYDGRA